MKAWFYAVAVVIGALFLAQSALAGSEMEILLKKLQQKGILTAEEADEIAKETKQTAAEEKKAAEEKAAAQKAEIKQEVAKSSALPEWVKNTKLKGDLRLRYEARDREDDQRGTQGRGRFRLRAGLETAINDKVTAGFGLTSGTGDLRTANQTFTGTFNRKSVWIDNAYVRYAPTTWLSVIGGKFINPVWQPSDMLISTDINMEGGAVRLEGQVAPSVGLFFNGGGFVLDDRNGSSSGSRPDPLLYVFQPGVKWNITKDTFVRFAPAYYQFANLEGETVLTPANTTLSSTNTALGVRTGTNAFPGRYAFDYSAINWGAEVGFNKPFGISAIPYFGIMGGYIDNTDPSKNNIGYLAGFSVGYQNVQKFGDWALEYTFRRLEKDAWLDLFPESSFYNGNTNVAGHRVKFLFGLAKNTALGLNFYDTWKLRNFSPTSSTTSPRATRDLSLEERLFQADFIVKF